MSREYSKVLQLFTMNSKSKPRSRMFSLVKYVFAIVIAITIAVATTKIATDLMSLRLQLKERDDEVIGLRRVLLEKSQFAKHLQAQLLVARNELHDLRNLRALQSKALKQPTDAIRVDRTQAEKGLTDWYAQRWGSKHLDKGQWRTNDLCSLGIGYERNGSDVFVAHTKLADQFGAVKKMNESFDCNDAPAQFTSVKSTIHDRWHQVVVNDKVLTVDDIIYGYERIFETRSLHSAVNFMGVALQQDPNDAFVIADMLWRIQPDLVIELGTSGGGSAHFFAHIMEAYNPNAKILTMDPSVLKLTGKQSLVNWNFREIRIICPHCTPANETDIWKRGNIEFLRMNPLDPRALAIASSMAVAATRVVVIEDSAHKYNMVLSNIRAYSQFVTPGSYMLVQDTRGGRWAPARAIDDFLALPEGSEFQVDRRWEYLVFTQHTGGWLKKNKA